MARKTGERASDEPHPLPPIDIRPDSSDLDALPEAEAAGERDGMSKRATAPGRASRRRARPMR